MKTKIMRNISIFFLILILISIITLIVVKYILDDRKLDMFIEDNSINRICQDQKYDKLKDKGIYSDKYLVKKWVKEKYPHIKIANVLFESKNPEDIETWNLPDNFVMKYTSGSRAFEIVRNGKYDKKQLIKTAKEYMNINYGNQNYRRIPFLGLQEPQYDYNEKRIIIEEFLGENIYEFRIMIIKGKILYYEMIRAGENDYGCRIFNKDEKRMHIEVDEKFKIDENEQMLPIEKLDEIKQFCKDFYNENHIDFVRVDFYISDDLKDYYFGELTFTPDNCRKSYNKEFNNYVKE
jgi:hypothetical protein